MECLSLINSLRKGKSMTILCSGGSARTFLRPAESTSTGEAVLVRLACSMLG